MDSENLVLMLCGLIQGLLLCALTLKGEENKVIILTIIVLTVLTFAIIADVPTELRALSLRREELRSRKKAFKMSVGKNVKRYREENGLNQTELAEKVNISQAMIARIESGTKLPSVAILKNIADVLHCSMDELVS